MGNLLSLGNAISVAIGAVLLALGVVGTLLVRRRLTGGHVGVPDLAAYRPEVVGYLTGGRVNATDTVLASLHARGVLDVTHDSSRRLTVVGPRPRTRRHWNSTRAL